MLKILQTSNNNKIIDTKFIQKPQRVRKKNSGYMWKAVFDVYLKNGFVITFQLWHNFLSDDLKWKPSRNMIHKYCRVKCIQYNGQYFDASSHIIIHKRKIYLSKSGYFHPYSDEITKKKYNDIKELLNSTKWIDNDDIILIAQLA